MSEIDNIDNMDNLTPEEQLQRYSDILIANIINKTDENELNREYLYGHISPEMFTEENYIIYTVFNKFKRDKIVPDTNFIQLYLERSDLILKSKSYIDVNKFSEIDEDPIIAYTSAVLSHYVMLQSIEQIPHDEFKLTVEKFRIEAKTIKLGVALTQAKLMLFEGLQDGREFKYGFESSKAYIKKVFAELESLDDRNNGAGFVDASVDGIKDDEESDPQLIADYGDIQELNEHFDGIYSGDFINILAPTKGGKSKFCCNVVESAIVKYGNNVSVLAHEGGRKGFYREMRALHFYHTYNKNQTDPTKIISGVSAKTLKSNRFASPEIRELEEASRIDLFTNPAYGKINMIDRPFNVETLIEDLTTSVELNNSKLVFIDYLQLIGSTSGLGKTERIALAYQLLLDFAKKHNVTIISPAQIKQDVINELIKVKDFNSIDLRTAGGESSEIIRTVDINIALYATPEDLQRRSMKLLSIPSRFAEPFQPFDIYADLGGNYFSSVEQSA